MLSLHITDIFNDSLLPIILNLDFKAIYNLSIQTHFPLLSSVYSENHSGQSTLILLNKYSSPYYLLLFMFSLFICNSLSTFACIKKISL